MDDNTLPPSAPVPLIPSPTPTPISISTPVNQTKVFITPSNNSKKIKIIGSGLILIFLLITLGMALKLSREKVVPPKAAFPSCVKSTRQADYPQTAGDIKIIPKEQAEEGGKWKLTWVLTGAKPNEHYTAIIKIHRCHTPTDTGGYDQCNAGDPNSEEITKTVSFDAPADISTTTEIPFSVDETVSCCERDQADLVSLNTIPWGSSFFIRTAWVDNATCKYTPPPPPPPTNTPTPTNQVTATPTLTGQPTPTLTITPTPTNPVATPTPLLGCQQTCTTDSDCNGNLRCQTVGGVKKCVNPTCINENDCICNKACWEICGQDSECPSGMNCYSANGISRCVNPACKSSQNCSCSAATSTPTPTTEILPNVGISLPTVGILTGGAVLILFSLLLAI